MTLNVFVFVSKQSGGAALGPGSDHGGALQAHKQKSFFLASKAHSVKKPWESSGK